MASLPTPAIVRIKRRLGSESSETIIVSSKRKRLDSDSDCSFPDQVPEMCTTILKKLTTLKQGDSIEFETRKALNSEPKHSWDMKANYKKGLNSNAKDLVKKKSKTDVAAIRFKLICSKRNIEGSESCDFNLFDAHKEKEESALMPLPSNSKNNSDDVISCNGVPMEIEKIEFVYDLYYTSFPPEFSTWIDSICEIQKYNEIEYKDESTKSNKEVYEDDEDDENSESNWRNDYPEEGGEEDEEGLEENSKFYDEDDFLCAEFAKKTNLDKFDEDSFDEDDYDNSGDFDEDGNLVTFRMEPPNVFTLRRKNKSETSSDESEND